MLVPSSGHLDLCSTNELILKKVSAWVPVLLDMCKSFFIPLFVCYHIVLCVFCLVLLYHHSESVWNQMDPKLNKLNQIKSQPHLQFHTCMKYIKCICMKSYLDVVH